MLVNIAKIREMDVSSSLKMMKVVLHKTFVVYILLLKKKKNVTETKATCT